ncbi:hypothetical protein EXIGLDRAFT_771925 [Exidia glandulosa HHB12029]|uniref:Uncharacterized protein n=1 Tax=Exidia glandulosa HHB12029 TaxID=1314781 RepID=A0A165FNR0_EXIGL|nr:hypothetical protein EXIGLDRAFT_771925 [Exidia glandulosa HHB12029]
MRVLQVHGAQRKFERDTAQRSALDNSLRSSQRIPPSRASTITGVPQLESCATSSGSTLTATSPSPVSQLYRRVTVEEVEDEGEPHPHSTASANTAFVDFPGICPEAFASSPALPAESAVEDFACSGDSDPMAVDSSSSSEPMDMQGVETSSRGTTSSVPQSATSSQPCPGAIPDPIWIGEYAVPDYLDSPMCLAFPGPYAPHTPGPFPCVHEFRAPEAVHESSHPFWFIRVFQMLSLVLHSRHHVSFAALGLLMFTVRSVFVGLRMLDPTAAVNNFRSFATVLARFKLKDDMFQIYPLCSICHHIAPPESPVDYTCPSCHLALFCHRTRLDRLTGKPPRAKKRVAIASLSEQLARVLYDDTVQKALEVQESLMRTSGKYTDCYDGRIMKTIRGVDGRRFFGPGPREKGELRIALTMMLDAFKPHSTGFADNHSVTAVSFALASLATALRYQHMIVTSVMPGPHEPSAEQMQEHLVAPVDDLLQLFEHGIRIYSPAYPEGRLVRAVLIAVVCDHPALCRVCGFADKNHGNAPCTRCKISQKDIKTAKAVRETFEPRDGAEHKRRAYEWKALAPEKRDAYFKEHGVRWYELARLPYFDPVRMAVVDPMHCLLLGVVKNLWFEVWVKGTKALRANTDAGRTRELDIIHKLLAEFEAPPWLGRLPKSVGEPAGGSLSSDEWRVLAEAYGPVVLPLVWWQGHEDAEREVATTQKSYEKRLRKFKKDQAAYVDKATLKLKGNKKSAAAAVARQVFLKKNPQPEQPSGRARRTPEEMPMLLSLSAALKLLLARSLTEAQRQRGKALLLEHLDRFCAIYGDEYLKYNQHWATHIPDEIPDLGPVYGFWTFPGERINKTIKSLNSNNHREGEMEISFLREFLRALEIKRELSRATQAATHPVEREILEHIAHERRQARGTVDVTREQDGDTPTAPADQTDYLESRNTDESNFGALILGPTGDKAALDHEQQTILAAAYGAMGLSVHTSFNPSEPPAGSARLVGYADFHSGSAASALVKLSKLPTDSTTCSLHGEVLNIFSHEQGRSVHTFATVRLLQDYTPGLVPQSWNFWPAYPELDVEYWFPGVYAGTIVVPLQRIVCQLARTLFADPDIWMTVALEKHFIHDIDLKTKP